MLDTMFCYTSRLALKLAIFKSHKNPVSASQMSTLWRHLHRSQFWTDRSIVLMSSWVKSSWQAASWGGNTVRKAIGLAKQQGLQSGKGEEPSLLFYNLLGYKIHSVLETQLSPQEQHWSLLGGGAGSSPLDSISQTYYCFSVSWHWGPSFQCPDLWKTDHIQTLTTIICGMGIVYHIWSWASYMD